MHTRHCISCFVLRTIDGQTECLLLKRGQLEDYPGTWQLLSGQIEHGESSRQAVIRHLEQIAHLEPIELYALNKTRESFLPRHDAIVQATMFVAQIESDAHVKLVGRLAEFRWVKLSELDAQLLFTVDREALDEMRRDILSPSEVKSLLMIPLD